MLFIDANQYLLLYGVSSGKAILQRLVDLKGAIFVTEQIVSEVERNKVRKAREYLSGQTLKWQGIGLPDHLLGVDEAKLTSLRRTISEIGDKAKELTRELDTLGSSLLQQISESTDPVSVALKPVFKDAHPAQPDELARARVRKELGRPPGKNSNPLGDELSWEQFLSHVRAADVPQVWIVTNDSDYIEKYNNSCFLNAVLTAELYAAGTSYAVHAHCFDDIAKGMQNYIETCKPKNSQPFSKAELEHLEKEFSQLLPSCASQMPPMYITFSGEGCSVQLQYKDGYWEGHGLKVQLIPSCQMVEINGCCYSLSSLNPLIGDVSLQGQRAILTW